VKLKKKIVILQIIYKLKMVGVKLKNIIEGNLIKWNWKINNKKNKQRGYKIRKYQFRKRKKNQANPTSLLNLV